MPASTRKTPARRPVRKAGQSGELMAVYDQAGNLLGTGTCKVSAVRELVQHPASKPPAKQDSVSPQLAGELDTTPNPPDSLQPQPSSAAGTKAHAVAKSARRAGLRLVDDEEVRIAKLAADRVRLAVQRGDTPAGVALARAHAAGHADEQIRRHRAGKAGQAVEVRKAAGATSSPAPDSERSWEAATRALHRIRGDV